METLIEVNKKEIDWVLIFSIAWDLDETNADKTFNWIYKEIEDFSGNKIIFDLEKLKYLNSKSIWYIADIYSTIEEKDWLMNITSCDEWVKDILELVWLTTIIPTFDTLDEWLTNIKNS